MKRHLWIGCIFFLILLFSVSKCRLPEDLKKKPDESLNGLKESGAYPEEIFLKIEHRTVYAVSSGCESKNKNILIFIHGSPGGWNNYSWYLGDPELRNFFCIVSFDRPGFGKSGAERPIPDVEKQARILDRAIDSLTGTLFKEKKILLVGHSYGGPIAAKIASDTKDPSRMGLILLAAPLSAEVEEVQWYNRVADWSWIKRILPNEINNSNEEMLPLKSQLASLETAWKRIRCKTVMIHGRDDSLVPFSNLEYLKTVLPATILKTVELEDEDHFIPWTQKDRIRTTILNFFEG
ncbi:alpha/beta hydrolase [Leptospira gomenensis]|uniref:Alpha/beta hydrolase n=1 Tax=Leptospira gomenensis TaxID=2484974 RepID=A0A5F1Y8J6_9LEPT|nr:alpha/beta hydrolase [Leptospira gomenensis]TGK31700.1 alpha/beta hydrolase [Leptospira gomenensis]TGK41671.1 alpha/beta hydrolase [Leptospira gomenensis]TGK43375.1 alpha/beta hydrolase [Leptospira gomenensis]TGK61369.1 alpha/beta hydrolase [Leptospira gomenensis]